MQGNEAIHRHIKWHIERNRERDRERETREGKRMGNTISPEIALRMDAVTRYLRLNQRWAVDACMQEWTELTGPNSWL